jgi:hypothetical protein
MVQSAPAERCTLRFDTTCQKGLEENENIAC